MAIVSAKPGSGVPHMMPFAPIAALVFAMAFAKKASVERRRTYALALVGGLIVLGGPLRAYAIYQIIVRNEGLQVFDRDQELLAYARRYPKLEMAPVDWQHSYATYNRVVLGLSGHRAKFDVVNWMDLRFAGIPAERIWFVRAMYCSGVGGSERGDSVFCARVWRPRSLQ